MEVSLSGAYTGGSDGDEDGSGGQSPSRQGAERGTSWPPKLVLMAAELYIVFWKILRVVWHIGENTKGKCFWMRSFHEKICIVSMSMNTSVQGRLPTSSMLTFPITSLFEKVYRFYLVIRAVYP